MVASKFLVITTLCYVGIFAVIFIVCCCAWTRHRRKERRGNASQQRSNQTSRRVYRPPQPPEYHAPSTPVTYGAPRSYEFVEEIQTATDGNAYFPTPQRAHKIPAQNTLHPIVGHFPAPVFSGYPRGNLYPTTVTTRAHAAQIRNCGETVTSREGYSGDDFSDATSSRFGGGDSALADTEDKNSVALSEPRSRSVHSEKEVESDVSSIEVSHLQRISLREERC